MCLQVFLCLVLVVCSTYLSGGCMKCVFVGCALCIVSCDLVVLNHGFGNMFLLLWNIGIGMFLECYVKMWLKQARKCH